MAARKKAVTETAEAVVEAEFSRQQLVASEKYSKRRDLVEALLDEGKKYTITEVDRRVDKFMKGQVK